MRSILLFAILFTLGARAQEWTWAVDAGGTGNTDICWDLATDSHGNVYAATSIGGTADFGCGTVSSTPAAAAGALAKYDSTGACQWVRGITTGFNEAWAYGIAIDAQDRIYVTGSYNGNAAFGNGITLGSLGSDDIFLARYDVDGNCLWARRAGASGAHDEARSVAVSDSGAVFITGFCGGGTVLFDTISIPNPSNYRQIAVARYDSTGAVQWAKLSTGNGQEKSARAISVANGRLYITGHIGFVTTSFDGLPVTTDNTSAGLYVLACGLDGTPLWARAYGTGDHEGMGIAADTLGNLFVAGRMWGSLYLPDDTLSSASSNDDIVLLGLDSAGTYRWAKGTGSIDRDLGWDVEADGRGYAYVVAQFQHSIDLFGTPLTSVGEEDLVVARVSNWGVVDLVKQGGGFQRDVGISIHKCHVGSQPVYTGGYYWGPVTYGHSTIDDVLNGDLMVVQLSDTTVDFPTAVAPLDDERGMRVFPSPTTNRLTVQATRPITRAWITTAAGSSAPVVRDADGGIDVRRLAPGLYLLRVLLDDGSVVSRAFVKE